MKKIIKLTFIITLIVASFFLGKKEQFPNYKLAYLPIEIFGQVDGRNITFSDLPPEMQMNLIKLESQKQEMIENAIPEIILAKMINDKKINLDLLNEKIEVSPTEVNQYIKESKLPTEDSSLSERVRNKLLVDKTNKMKQKAIDNYSQKVDIVINEPSIKQLSLNTKNAFNISGTKNNQIVVFSSLEDKKLIDKILELIKEYKDSNITIFPLTSLNPYRDENLKKFICLKDQKNSSIHELNESVGHILEKYKCNEQYVNNQLYNVSNYAKSIGIYTPGLLVNGQWLNFDDKLVHNLNKRLLK